MSTDLHRDQHAEPPFFVASEDSSVKRPEKSRLRPLAWIFPAASAVWAAIAISIAAQDQSWGALYTAFFAGPIVNVIIALVGVVGVVVARWSNKNFAWGTPLVCILFGAVISTVVIIGSLAFMDLHGC